MKKSLASYLLFCLFYFTSQAQSYDDVAILINSDSPESIEIGTYFQSKHNIPAERVIQLPMSTNKVINVEEANALFAELNPILDALDGVNYIVTTLGCPTSFNPEIGIEQLNYSFESLIKDGKVESTNTPPLNFSGGEFTFEEFGIYIVARLEARTVSGTKALIDKGGHNNLNSQNPIMMDLVQETPYFNPLGLEYLTNKIEDWKIDNETDLNVPVEVDTDTSLYMVDTHLSGYLGYVLGDLTAEMGADLVCKTEGLAMVLNASGALDSLDDFYLSALDFTELFCHGAVGVVDQFYINESIRILDVFNYYYNPNLEYNLGESFLLSLKYNSKYSFVLYGDPKSTVSFVSGVNNFSAFDFEVEIYPNPFSTLLTFKVSRKADPFTMDIYSIDGKRIMTREMGNIENERVDVSHLPSASYIISVTSDSSTVSKIFVRR